MEASVNPPAKSFPKAMLPMCSKESLDNVDIMKTPIILNIGEMPSQGDLTLEFAKEVAVLLRGNIVCPECKACGQFTLNSYKVSFKIRCKKCNYNVDWKHLIPLIKDNEDLRACATVSLNLRKNKSAENTLATPFIFTATASMTKRPRIEDSPDSEYDENIKLRQKVVMLESRLDGLEQLFKKECGTLGEKMDKILTQTSPSGLPIIKKRVFTTSPESQETTTDKNLTQSRTYAQVVLPTTEQKAAVSILLRPRKSQQPQGTRQYQETEMTNVYFGSFEGRRPYSETRAALKNGGVNVTKIRNIDYLHGYRVHLMVDATYANQLIAIMKGLGFPHLPNYSQQVIKDLNIPLQQRNDILKSESKRLARNITFCKAEIKPFFKKIYETCSDELKSLVDLEIISEEKRKVSLSRTSSNDIDAFMASARTSDQEVSTTDMDVCEIIPPKSVSESLETSSSTPSAMEVELQ